MALFAIADLHLSLGEDKPMDVFAGWNDYTSRLENNWRKLVTDNDTVVVSGDISWAMKLEETLTDFTFIENLPGKKIFNKGNHDYWLDATLGIKSGVAPGFWFDVFAGYKITSSDVLFLPSRIYDRDHFGNFSEAMSDIDTKQLFIGANLKYSYQQLFDVSLKGVYNNWKANFGDTWIGGEANGELAHAWGKPEMEVTAGLTVRPVKNVSVLLDYYLATGRYTQLGGAGEYKMNNINELNLTGTYTFNDTFGVYAKLNNILCQKYEVYYGYPLQSFSAMIGVNINF